MDSSNNLSKTSAQTNEISSEQGNQKAKEIIDETKTETEVTPEDLKLEESTWLKFKDVISLLAKTESHQDLDIKKIFYVQA